MESSRSRATCRKTKSAIKSNSLDIIYNIECRVLVFKEAPILIYSGLNRAIGKPRDMEKNNEEGGKYFDSDFDISIPVEITNEYKQSGQNNLVLIINDLYYILFRVLKRLINMRQKITPSQKKKRRRKEHNKSNKKHRQCLTWGLLLSTHPLNPLTRSSLIGRLRLGSPRSIQRERGKMRKDQEVC